MDIGNVNSASSSNFNAGSVDSVAANNKVAQHTPTPGAGESSADDGFTATTTDSSARKAEASLDASAVKASLSLPTTDGKVKGHDGHKSGPELSVGYGFGKAPKGKVEYKSKDGEGKFKGTLEQGPVVIKVDGKKHWEVGVKAGPATVSLEDGNPKAAVGAEVGIGVGPAEVKVEAKLEGKASILSNSDPYSAGDVDINAEAKIKAKGVEVGAKENLYHGQIYFGPGGSTSEAIRKNREALAEASGIDVKNIKQELQEDQAAGAQPKESSRNYWQDFKNGASDLLKMFKHLGEPYELDKDGRMIYRDSK
jgi:hypothetical protein